APDGRIGRAEGSVGPDEIATVEITVAKTGTLRGTVVDADGLPVAGAEVSAMTDREWRNLGLLAAEGGRGPFRPDATTGPDGGFTVGEFRLRAEPYVLHATDGPQRAGLVERIDPFSIPPTGIRIVLRPTHVLSGRVLGPDSRPMIATVDLQRVGEPDTSARPRVWSGPDGTFRFVNLPEGGFDLWAMAPGYSRASVRARAGDGGVEIRLAPSVRVFSGRVRLTRDIPFPRVLGPRNGPPWKRLRSDNALRVVLLSEDPAEGPLPPEAEVDRSLVHLEDPSIYLQAPLGSPRLWLALMACGRTVDVREVSGEEILFDFDLEATVPQLGGLRILALDALKGEPISDFKVSLCADGRGPSWTARALAGDVVGPLLPGRYSAVVRAAGYEPATLEDLTVEAGRASETIEVRLRRN
ncbi:MAG: carboxypeptidase-like regulatory domain-containing protein, partial [Planctomycetota bacterium]